MAKNETLEATAPVADEAQKQIAALEAALAASKQENAVLSAKLEETTSLKPKSTLQVIEEEPRVRIKLFKDNKDYKDDLICGINGKVYQIQRGVEVEVPKSVAEVIEHSVSQDEKTALMIEQLTSEASDKSKQLN